MFVVNLSITWHKDNSKQRNTQIYYYFRNFTFEITHTQAGTRPIFTGCAPALALFDSAKMLCLTYFFLK